MKTRITIDPNIRVRDGQTYAGFEDIEGMAFMGAPVEVIEPEAGLTGSATITDLDHETRLVYLAVDWSSLHRTMSAVITVLFWIVVAGGVVLLACGMAGVFDDEH